MIQKLTLVSIGDTTSVATNYNLLVGTVKKLISFFFMIDIVLRLILILKAEVLRRTPENPPLLKCSAGFLVCTLGGPKFGPMLGLSKLSEHRPQAFGANLAFGGLSGPTFY